MNADQGAQVLVLRDAGRVAGSVFEQLALATAPRVLAPARNSRLRAQVLRRAIERTPPVGTRTFHATDSEWRALAPGVELKLLRPDIAADQMVALIRMRAGATFAAHGHPDTEECLVLDGEIRIGTHQLNAGDLHVASAGTWHEATWTPRGALLLVRAAESSITNRLC